MLLMSQQLNSKAAFKSFDKRQFRQVYHTLIEGNNYCEQKFQFHVKSIAHILIIL